MESLLGLCHLNKHLTNIACVADGCKIPIQKASDNLTQNAHCKGWKCDHFITNFFAFGPNGTIVVAISNCPGTLHDLELALTGNPSVCTKLEHHWNECGAHCAMDSAFAAESCPFTIKSIQRESIETKIGCPEEALICNQALSVQQSAEWGVRLLQGSVPRLEAQWKCEENDWSGISLNSIALLHNCKANNMDLNQTRAVHWKSHQAELETAHALGLDNNDASVGFKNR